MDAGANCIATATYQASFAGFQAAGCTHVESERLLLLAVELAVNARTAFLAERDKSQDTLLVAGSIGPFGAYLADGSEYRGNYAVSREDLVHFHRERLHILADLEIDVLAFETIPSFEEASVLLELLESRPSRMAWFSFSCRDAQHISDGTPLQKCADLLADHPQVWAIGVNCIAPSMVVEAIAILRAAAPQKRIAVYPNSGERYDPDKKCWIGTAEPVEFGQASLEWLEAGAHIIGGCCRTSPAHISTMHHMIANRQVRDHRV